MELLIKRILLDLQKLQLRLMALGRNFESEIQIKILTKSTGPLARERTQGYKKVLVRLHYARKLAHAKIRGT